MPAALLWEFSELRKGPFFNPLANPSTPCLDLSLTVRLNHSDIEIYKTITAQLKSNNDPNTKNSEDHFLIEGLYPTVSLQTHKRGHTTGSCIDNIFISDFQHVICSGVIPGIGKHHSPIFTLSSLNPKKTNPKNEKHKMFYDYSNENIDNFMKSMQQKN